jgi:hypothetical protein
MNTLDELEAIRARHTQAEVRGGDTWDSGHVEWVWSDAHADRATLLAHVDQLDAERKALRALCLEAAEFYGYGGTFPIRGVMAMRLTGAALGTLATALAKDATHKGTPMLVDGDERTTVRIFTPYDLPTRAQGESS